MLVLNLGTTSQLMLLTSGLEIDGVAMTEITASGGSDLNVIPEVTTLDNHLHVGSNVT